MQAAKQEQAQPDSVLRSAVKGFIWRIFSTSATVTIALLIFKENIKVGAAQAAPSNHAATGTCIKAAQHRMQAPDGDAYLHECAHHCRMVKGNTFTVLCHPSSMHASVMMPTSYEPSGAAQNLRCGQP